MGENIATETKTITNIYYDCLERIFEYLDIESSLNVAGTCKRLQIGAAHYFSEKFSNMEIMLHEAHVPYISKYKESIDCCGLKHSLPFLRIFGHKISKLNAYGITGV